MGLKVALFRTTYRPENYGDCMHFFLLFSTFLKNGSVKTFYWDGFNGIQKQFKVTSLNESCIVGMVMSKSLIKTGNSW